MREKILIVGAGIAGLSLARQLKKFNIPYTLIEKRKHFFLEGAGIGLPANAVKALRYLGLGKKIDEHAHQVKEIIYTEVDGTLLSCASLLEPPFNSDRFVALHRTKLHNILLEGLDANIHLDTAVKNIYPKAQEIIVEFNSPTLKKESFSAVIGADGVHSSIRSFFISEEEATKAFNYTIWRWVVDYSTDNLSPTYMIGFNDLFMAYPISKNEVYCYANISDPESQYVTSDAQKLLFKHFSHYGGIAKELLRRLPTDKKIIVGRMRVLKKPILRLRQHIALIGDAAHACTPAFQQGAASALEDSIVLSELLNRFPVREALSLYEKLRIPRLTWIHSSSNLSTEKIVHPNPELLQKRFKNIRQYGPTNVQGWIKLFSLEDFLVELKGVLKDKETAF